MFIYYFLYYRVKEPQVLDYQSQQLKLFPNLATAYAFVFVGNTMQTMYARYLSELADGQYSGLPEVITISIVFKWFQQNYPIFSRNISHELYVTQYNKKYILSTSEKIEICVISNSSNDTQFLKIKVILLEIQLLHSVYFLLFSLYSAYFVVRYHRINLANKMSLFCTGSHMLSLK